MTRKVVNESGKSCIRHTLAEKFPSCMYQGSKSEFKDTLADLLVIDLLNYIKQLPYKDSEGPESPDFYNTGEEKVRDYYSAITYLANKITKAAGLAVDSDGIGPKNVKSEMDNDTPLTVVVSIDKYKYVCGARTIVHGDRKGKKHEKPLAEGEFKRPSIGDEIVYPFAQITEDKKFNSAVLFGFLISGIISTLSDRVYNRSVNFIFDGHCMSMDDLSVLQSFNGVKAEDCYSTPIILMCDRSIHDRKCSWLPEFRNKIGESDFLAYFYAKNYSKLPYGHLRQKQNKLHVDILSRDTDSILYAMIYISLRHIDEVMEEEITVGYEFVKFGCPMKWVDINKLVSMIEKQMNKYGGSMIQYPALQLAVASLAVGSDYTEKHDQYPQPHFINGYLDYCYNIGDIVEVKEKNSRFYRLKLKGSEYTRYIAMGYVSSKSKLKAWQDFNPDNFKRESLYGVVREKLIKTYPLDNKFWLPNDTDLVLSAKQFQYYINMMSRIGESSVDVELQDSNLVVYGYKHEYIKELDETVIVREISNYTEDEILELTYSVHGVKATDKLIEKRTEKRKRGESIDEGEGKMIKEKKRGKGVKQERKKKRKTEPEYIEGIDLE